MTGILGLTRAIKKSKIKNQESKVKNSIAEGDSAILTFAF